MQFNLRCSLILLLFQLCMAQYTRGQVTNKLDEDPVGEILSKISKISVLSLANAKDDDKKEILKKVEEKLTKAAKSFGKKGERYVKLILEGIKAKVFKENISSSTSHIQADIPAIIQSNENRLNQVKENNDGLRNSVLNKSAKNANNDPENNLAQTEINLIQKPAEEVKNLRLHTTKRKHFVLRKFLKQMKNATSVDKIHNRADTISQETSAEHLDQIFTPRHDCKNLDGICMNIKQMRLLKCHFGDAAIPIQKLCDGFIDCPDRTDEKFCTSQVTERVRNANDVISEVEYSFTLDCFPNTTKKSIMTTQIVIFRSILESQQAFVSKYKYLNMSQIPNTNVLKGKDIVKKTVNEISLVISGLSLALDAALCSQRVRMADVLNTRKFNDLLDEDLDQAIKEVEWPPKSCFCQRDRCENVTCSDSCRRVCWEKYSLTRWGCQSINKTENVPMSTICDGKFDCFDESDEKGCITGTTFAKYEGHEIFKEIFAMLSGKITSKEYSSIRNTLLSLHHSIESLQKYCMVSKPDIEMISKLRDKCFSALSSIYSETLIKSSFRYETEEAYLFLLSINEKIVSALKRSNSGNRRIIASNTCYCKNGQCSMPICSRKCIRACIAEPILTRYSCEGSVNKTVSLEEICNGNPNCPQKDDETDCEKDVCRRHHLSVLRRSLERIGKKQEGTSMGELLATWKTKVTSTLAIAENNDRPTPRTIREVVKDILSDLVTTYGALEDYRRNNEYALNEFNNIAKQIMNTVKSCGF